MNEDDGFKERYLMKDFTVESSIEPPADEKVVKSKEFLKRLAEKFVEKKEIDCKKEID